MGPGRAQALADALRYTLALLDSMDERERSGAPDEPVTDLPGALAGLVIAARRDIARTQLGITDSAGQNQCVRALILAEIEVHELNASFAAVAAEMAGPAVSDPGPEGGG